MKKIITVYVVSEFTTEGDQTAKLEGGKSKVYATKTKANEAVEICSAFGISVKVFVEKRTATIS